MRFAELIPLIGALLNFSLALFVLFQNPRAAGSGNVDVAFRRSAAKRTWPVAFAALCKPSEIIIRDILPAA